MMSSSIATEILFEMLILRSSAMPMEYTSLRACSVSLWVMLTKMLILRWIAMPMEEMGLRACSASLRGTLTNLIMIVMPAAWAILRAHSARVQMTS